jgi:hypothetical protein
MQFLGRGVVVVAGILVGRSDHLIAAVQGEVVSTSFPSRTTLRVAAERKLA